MRGCSVLFTDILSVGISKTTLVRAHRLTNRETDRNLGKSLYDGLTY